MELKELRALEANDLNAKLVESRKELFNLRFQHTTAQLENTARIPAVKRDVARILTVLKEKERGV
ncbi:MAG: 50S ribosomal protein L29 [Desulfovibrionaceae bacterium]